MSKRVIIVHGWGGYPQKDWFPWIKNELKKRGYDVVVPAMPDPLSPKMEDWVGFISQIIGNPREDDLFIGHSIGCQTILRYLETVHDGKRIDKVIMIAPWVFLNDAAYEDEDDREIAKPWLQKSINWQKVKSKASSFTAIFSDNDPFVPLEENRRAFEEKLEVKVVVEHNKGHFTEGDGITELSIILELI